MSNNFCNLDLESLHAKFRSTNSVQVERATILREEYDKVCALENIIKNLTSKSVFVVEDEDYPNAG